MEFTPLLEFFGHAKAIVRKNVEQKTIILIGRKVYLKKNPIANLREQSGAIYCLNSQT